MPQGTDTDRKLVAIPRVQAHAIAGSIAGVVATLTTFPLDLVKTKFQVQDGRAETGFPRYRSTWHATREILASQGIRGLYAGLTANLVGSALSWGGYFLVYELLKDQLRSMQTSPVLGAGGAFASATLSGACVCLVTNPIWIVKTRMQMQPDLAPELRYRGVSHALVSIARSEGIAGLYRGLVPSLFGATHGGIQFVVYEELKKARAASPAWQRLVASVEPDGSTSSGLSSIEALLLGAASKVAAATVSYPYQVIRARLHMQREAVRELAHYRGPLDTIRKTWRAEGIVGFYKGLTPTVLRVLPSACVTFVVYEKLSQFLLAIRL